MKFLFPYLLAFAIVSCNNGLIERDDQIELTVSADTYFLDINEDNLTLDIDFDGKDDFVLDNQTHWDKKGSRHIFACLIYNIRALHDNAAVCTVGLEKFRLLSENSINDNVVVFNSGETIKKSEGKWVKEGRLDQICEGFDALIGLSGFIGVRINGKLGFIAFSRSDQWSRLRLDGYGVNQTKGKDIICSLP